MGITPFSPTNAYEHLLHQRASVFASSMPSGAALWRWGMSDRSPNVMQTDSNHRAGSSVLMGSIQEYQREVSVS